MGKLLISIFNPKTHVKILKMNLETLTESHNWLASPSDMTTFNKFLFLHFTIGVSFIGLFVWVFCLILFCICRSLVIKIVRKQTLALNLLMIVPHLNCVCSKTQGLGTIKDTPLLLQGTRDILRRKITDTYSVLKMGLIPCRYRKQKQKAEMPTS